MIINVLPPFLSFTVYIWPSLTFIETYPSLTLSLGYGKKPIRDSFVTEPQYSMYLQHRRLYTSQAQIKCKLIVHRTCTRLLTIGDRAIPCSCLDTNNSLPQHVTAAPSLSVLHCRMKTNLFRHWFLWLYPPYSYCCVREVHRLSVIVGHVNRSLLLTYLAENVFPRNS